MADWMIERLAAGDLEPRRLADLRVSLGREGEAHLRARAESDAAILAQYPPEVMLPKIRERSAQQANVHAGMAKPPRRTALGVLALVPAAGIALWLLAPVGRVAAPPVTQEAPATTRAKAGLARLLVYAMPHGSTLRLADGATVRGGQTVQIGYVAGGGRFGVVISIDQQGEITRHHPLDGPQAPRLSSARTLLPQSFELDDKLGFERLFLVTAEAPFAVDEVLGAARALASGGQIPRAAPLPLRSGFDQTSFLLQKVSP